MIPSLKRCSKCQESFPLDRFHKEKSRADGYHAWCNTCANAYRRDKFANSAAWRARIKKSRQRYYSLNAAHVIQRTRKSEILRKYGLAWDDYQKIMEMQAGKCALCGIEKPGGKGAWHIDHDHRSGRVRGFLCHRCNTQFGTYEHVLEEFGSARLWEYSLRNAVAEANAVVKRRRKR